MKNAGLEENIEERKDGEENENEEGEGDRGRVQGPDHLALHRERTHLDPIPILLRLLGQGRGQDLRHRHHPHILDPLVPTRPILVPQTHHHQSPAPPRNQILHPTRPSHQLHLVVEGLDLP